MSSSPQGDIVTDKVFKCNLKLYVQPIIENKCTLACASDFCAVKGNLYTLTNATLKHFLCSYTIHVLIIGMHQLLKKCY